MMSVPRTRVKICGITRSEDAACAVKLGAAALGFNFYQPSPRYIAPAAAALIIRQLPPFVTAVGVFADETDGRRIVRLAELAGVGAVQLHGPQLPRGAESGWLERFPVIRAVAVREGFEVRELEGIQAAALLLDGFDPARLGGTGRPFDWQIAKQAKQYGHVILAGGLTPGNVHQAVSAVRPFAVDVASGVESAPGIKDPEKVRAFIEAVEQADRSGDEAN
jgi:phosphoribosylanthranilate isomerase